MQETTVFRQYGPLSGNTLRAGYTFAPPAGSFLLSRQTVEVDGRTYLRLGENGVLAFRAQGFKSWGDFPDFKFFGGNNELRGYDYYQFIGHNVLIANLELRFPLIEAMATPLGVLGGVRGTFFLNFGTASFNSTGYDAFSTKDTVARGVDSLCSTKTSRGPAVLRTPVAVSGLRLINGRASYGFGLTTYAIGFPIHIDWAWRTMFNRTWEDLVFALEGGSDEFRRVRVSLWIGHDF